MGSARLTTWIAIVLAILACTGQRAFAHAALIASMPEDGTVLSAAPPLAGLRFSEPVRPIVMRLTAPDGRATDITPRARGEHIEVPLPALTDGAHLLSWRVVSADGHPVSGTVSFAIGANAPPRATASATTDTRLAAGLWTARLLLYAGLLFGIGSAFALAWLAPGLSPQAMPRRIARLAIAAGVLGAVLGFGLAGADLIGGGWASLAGTGAWQMAASTTLAPNLAMTIGAFGAAGLSRGRSRALGLLGIALAAMGLAATGHAATAPPQTLARPAVAIHGALAMLWSGALFPLAWLAVTGHPLLQRALSRFSAAALAGVAALLAAGATLTALQLRTPADLLDTAYGQVLAAKLVAFAALLALAAWNRVMLTKPVLAGDHGAGRRLSRIIALEIALLLLVAGLVGVWRFTPPPRALLAAERPGVSVHIHDPRAMADVLLLPGEHAGSRAQVTLLGGDYDVMPAKEVTVILANPEAGIEPIERKAIRLPDGRWQADGFVMPVAGRWTVRIDVLIDDFDKLMMEGSVIVGR
jgi:copper transport protein